MTRRIAAFLALALAPTGCTQQDVCVDVFPNATVTDVLHDEDHGRLYVSVLHHLSYCTGTDEKKHSVELIEVDLGTGEVSIQQRAQDGTTGFDVPETCCSLFTDGNFAGGDECPGCQLILRSRDGTYTFAFDSGVDWNLPLTLTVSREASQLAVVDIGGYASSVRE